jgi:hypothetical protein
MDREYFDQCAKAGCCALCRRKPNGEPSGLRLESPQHDPYRIIVCESCYPAFSFELGIMLGKLIMQCGKL